MENEIPDFFRILMLFSTLCFSLNVILKKFRFIFTQHKLYEFLITKFYILDEPIYFNKLNTLKVKDLPYFYKLRIRKISNKIFGRFANKRVIFK